MAEEYANGLCYPCFMESTGPRPGDEGYEERTPLEIAVANSIQELEPLVGQAIRIFFPAGQGKSINLKLTAIVRMQNGDDAELAVGVKEPRNVLLSQVWKIEWRDKESLHSKEWFPPTELKEDD